MTISYKALTQSAKIIQSWNNNLIKTALCRVDKSLRAVSKAWWLRCSQSTAQVGRCQLLRVCRFCVKLGVIYSPVGLPVTSCYCSWQLIPLSIQKTGEEGEIYGTLSWQQLPHAEQHLIHGRMRGRNICMYVRTILNK